MTATGIVITIVGWEIACWCWKRYRKRAQAKKLLGAPRAPKRLT